jgi:signal transduction histidine kinase
VDITHMRQAMAQRDQAMHFISHDIRAPIGAIITLLEMDRTFANPSLSPATRAPRDTTARIERYARSALELAEDFVYLARAQQHPPRQEAVELGQLIDQALDDSWTLAQTKQIRLEWQPQEREALITGDPSQLRRVLVNLLGNAIKYSPAGSCVHCKLEERPAHWVVVLRDEGDGISPEQQATLFAPFARQAQHENSAVQGLGLGLAFVHTVMQRHGAHIELDSALGQGSSFRLVFAKRTT